MKKDLAESLLAKIMDWSDAQKAQERARLEGFAAYKYDRYQRYTPGRRFIESLALWLRQFDPGEERQIAYEFVRNRLLFISEDEMNYLVGLVFPTIIRPMLMKDAAAEAGIAPERVKAIVASPEYRARRRRTLFLGLSDGARTDQFRRANPQDISNEQVFHAYDISNAKAETMIAKLKKDLREILGRDPTDEEARFQYIVLSDDFSASGTSAIRFKDGEWDGKIPRIVEDLSGDTGLGLAIAAKDVKVAVVLYVASEQAIGEIERLLGELQFSKGAVSFEVVCRLGPDAPLDDTRDVDMLNLARQDRYFDPSVDDEHAAVAGTSKRLGYAECRLPLVMSHNTPNNSIFLLWAEEGQSVSGLFPRVSRHQKRQ